MRKYKILSKIATGGMSTVYKASLKGKPVCIKELHPHLAQDKSFVSRFEREAFILKKIKHENIVRILDYYTKDNSYFIVLEYLEGISLQELIAKEGKIPYDVALVILQKIAEGLSYAHERSVLHRDIKPANILITTEGKVKITDFGLAIGAETVSITDPGIYIGTPAYMAPERMKGSEATPTSDIFSLGPLFYEMLSGSNPFLGKTHSETINRILNTDPPPLKLPLEICSICEKLLKKNPKSRYQRVSGILKDVKSLSPHGSVKSWMKDPQSYRIRGIRKNIFHRTKRLWKAASLAILIPVTYFAFAYMSKKQEESLSSMDSFTVAKRPDSSTIVNPPTVPVVADSGIANNETLTVVEAELGYGFLKVVCKPWADVYIDGKFFAQTPFDELIRLEEGEHELILRHPNRNEYKELITIPKGDTIAKVVTLPEVYGFLNVVSIPWAKIIVDGEEVGTTPLEIKLTIGKHKLELQNPNYKKWGPENIVIEEGKTLKKVVPLEG